MGSLKPLTIMQPEEMADTISAAVADGEYASTSDVIRDALLAWTTRHARQADERLALQADIDRDLRTLPQDGHVRLIATRLLRGGGLHDPLTR